MILITTSIYLAGTEELVAIAAAGGDGLLRPRALPAGAAGADETDAASRHNITFWTIIFLALAAVVSTHTVVARGSTAVNESLMVMAGTEELVAIAAVGGSFGEDPAAAIHHTEAVEAGASLARTDDEGRRAWYKGYTSQRLHATAHQGDEVAIDAEVVRSLEARRLVTGETPLHMLATRDAHTPAISQDTASVHIVAVSVEAAAESDAEAAAEDAAAALTPSRQQVSAPAAAASAATAPVDVAEAAAAAAANLEASLVRAMRGYPAAPISTRRWLAARAWHGAA